MKNCNKYFRLQNLGFKPDNYEVFYRSQWQTDNSNYLYYVMYRILLASIFSTVLLISIIDINNINMTAVLRGKWFIYLTNWHLIITTFQSILSAHLVTKMYFHFRKRKEFHQTDYVNQTLCSVYWILYTIAINGTLLVSITYWILVYDEKVDTLSVANLFTHAINAILLLTDCFIVAHTIRFMHFYVPLIFNIIFVGFSAIYSSLGGTNKYDEPYIYTILDWKNYRRTNINIVVLSFFLLILHFFICVLVLLRKRLAKVLIKQENKHINFFSSPLMDPSKKESLELEDTNRNEVSLWSSEI